eukprot:6210212-Pleurochrysis_carterae.AAC.1
MSPPRISQQQSHAYGLATDSDLPLTPLNMKQVKEQIRRARDQQIYEQDPAMMRQRHVYILDLEAEVNRDRKERRRRRAAQHSYF